MNERAVLNMTTGELDVLARLAAARRELGDIAAVLLDSRTSKREQRESFGRRLNAVKSSLLTAELNLSARQEEEPS